MQKIADLVITGEVCADIGTDHGFIPFYLLQNGLCPYVILSDIADGPLEKAMENSEALGIYDDFDIRKAPGLNSLSIGEARTAIIAGMGGELISSILSESPDIARSIRRFILQPRSRSSVLRHFLLENSYRICGEYLAREAGRISEIILCDKISDITENFDSELSFEIPVFLFQDNDPEIVKEFIDDKIRKTDAVLSELAGSDNAEKLSEWRTRFEELKNIRSRL